MTDINKAVMDEFVDSIDEELSDEMMRLIWIRNTTLDCIYSIPDYPYLSHKTQLDIYDAVRELVERFATSGNIKQKVEA